MCECCAEKQARILKLEHRIHNQRVALRENWQIVEMRAHFTRWPTEVRSRFLAGWSRAERKVRELRERLGRYEAVE